MDNEQTKELQAVGEKAGLVQSTPQPTQVATIWNDKALLEQAWKTAGFLSKTDLVPDTYRGRPENCLIALDLSNRSGMSPLTVMQNLYVVKGKPAWSGQFIIALVNSSGRYLKPLNPVFVGEKGTLSYGCYMETVALNGEKKYGTTVTMQMAKDEGWIDKAGSKWKTMPEQMLMYRAGAFFARVHCPDVLYGIQMVDEVKDTNGYDEEEKTKVRIEL